MELTPAGEWIIAISFAVVILLWVGAVATAWHNDRRDGPPIW